MLVLKKKIAQAQPTPEDTDDALVALLDKYQAETDALAPITAQIKDLGGQANIHKAEQAELVKQIIEYFPDLKTKFIDDGLEKKVQNYLIEFGPASMKRHVHDLAGLREYLGDENFMALASVKLGDIDKYVPVPDQEKYVTSARDPDTRSFKLIKLAPAKKN